MTSTQKSDTILTYIFPIIDFVLITTALVKNEVDINMKVKIRNLYLTDGYLSKAEYPYFGFISTVKSFSTPSCSFLKRASNSFSFDFSSNSSSFPLKAATLLKTSIASSVLFLEKNIRAEFSRTKKYIIPHVTAIIF